MNNLDKIVTVDIVGSSQFTYSADYCILVDATVNEVIECAKKHPKAFVFTFDTTPVDKIKTDMVDYTPLHPAIEEYMDDDGDIMHRFAEGSYKPWMDRLVQCLYIGNFKSEDHKSVIDKFIENSIGEDRNLIYSNK